MDILKIRKKKRDEQAAPEPSPKAAPSTTAEPSPTTEAATTEPAATSPPPAAPPPAARVVEPAPSPPPPAPPPPAPSPSPPRTAEASRRAVKAAAGKARAPEPGPAPVDDPLVEFLARYDDGAEQMVVGGESAESTRDESKRYLAFELAGEEYAASIMEIREILRVLTLTAVPRAPREILGVISKRGLVMPVIDLAASLGLRDPDPAWSPRQRILVVGEADRVCGLRVDRVLEVVRLRAHDVEEVPTALGSRSRHQLRGLGRVGERMFILLDMPAVLHAMAVAAGLEAREEAS